MPTKEKTYSRVIFTPEVIKEAVQLLRKTLPEENELLSGILTIKVSPIEEWHHDTEEEFFADYLKGFEYVNFEQTYYSKKKEKGAKIGLWCQNNNTSVSISMKNRTDVERVFNVLESNVEKCRLPKQPQMKSKTQTNWVTETINKIEGRCPIAGRKLKSALIKLDSDEVEEWQNATMLIRDAWIELTQWLCKVKNIDTSDITPDAVIDRLKKLGVDKTDERLFNLARASFNLYSKHHKRDISNDTATACVISTIVSMQTVIREVF